MPAKRSTGIAPAESIPRRVWRLGPQLSLPSVRHFARSGAHPCSDLAPFSPTGGRAARRQASSPCEVAPPISPTGPGCVPAAPLPSLLLPRCCILPPCPAAPPPEVDPPAPFLPRTLSPPAAVQQLSPPLPLAAPLLCAAGALPAGLHPLQAQAFLGRLPAAPLVRRPGLRRCTSHPPRARAASLRFPQVQWRH